MQEDVLTLISHINVSFFIQSVRNMLKIPASVYHLMQNIHVLNLDSLMIFKEVCNERTTWMVNCQMCMLMSGVRNSKGRVVQLLRIKAYNIKSSIHFDSEVTVNPKAVTMSPYNVIIIAH